MLISKRREAIPRHKRSQQCCRKCTSNMKEPVSIRIFSDTQLRSQHTEGR